MNPATATIPDPPAGGADQIRSPLAHLSETQLEELAKEFDAIHDEVYADLGARDRKYIQSMIELHRRLAVMSRLLLLASPNRAAWVAGTATNSAAKILENMEIGHNVLHGQWDWMNDPQIHSTTWDWDTASTAEAWKHSHNYVHHTYTNILGKDKDLGYEIMRIDPDQRWHPVYLAQPIYNIILMAFFEWGVATHDLDFEAIRKGEKSKEQVKEEVKDILGKARDQILKDYVAWPAVSGLAGAAASVAVSAATGRFRRRKERRKAIDDALTAAKRGFKSTASANFTANIVRNFWSNAIIFCGHFPDQTYVFSQKEVENESRGAWYVRQLAGAANIDGGPLFHVASGNLSYQVEHHLYPDMPSTRYAEIAPRVKDICERYGLPYNTGPFLQQWTMVQRTILRLAFPGGRHRPKPAPYMPEE
ncbi:MAG TPA: fatty acid desaturase [Solirubrobacterales bacterium]|nr:fatty acid desaturase [Solirubrobacterales bacterium]